MILWHTACSVLYALVYFWVTKNLFVLVAHSVVYALVYLWVPKICTCGTQQTVNDPTDFISFVFVIYAVIDSGSAGEGPEKGASSV